MAGAGQKPLKLLVGVDACNPRESFQQQNALASAPIPLPLPLSGNGKSRQVEQGHMESKVRAQGHFANNVLSTSGEDVA